MLEPHRERYTRPMQMPTMIETGQCARIAALMAAGRSRPAGRSNCLHSCAVALCCLVPLAAVAQATQPGRGQQEVVITKVGQAHDLPQARAAGTRLHLTGEITYYDTVDGIMFLQDATGGIYINTDKDYPLRNGDLVEVDGFASPSYRTEVANDPQIRKLGRERALAAPPHDYRELVTGHGDCELVTVRGKVRAADVEQHLGISTPSVHLDLTMPDGEIQVYIHPSSGFHPESLLDATVEITGVAGGAFDAKNQLTGVILYAPEASSLRIIEPPSVSARQLPLTAIDEVFQSRRVNDTSRPVRVRGTITYYKKGDSAVIEESRQQHLHSDARDGRLCRWRCGGCDWVRERSGVCAELEASFPSQDGAADGSLTPSGQLCPGGERRVQRQPDLDYRVARIRAAQWRFDDGGDQC